MISKIIIVAIATGIGLASYIPKGIDEAMNNPQRISEYQEYKKHTDTVKIEEKIEDMAEADEAKELVNKAELEELEAQLEGMNAIEIQQYLEKHNIEYSFDEVTGYPYKQWCIIIPKGEYVIHIHWYDDRVEEIYMGIENVNETDSICIKYGIHVYN